MPDTPPDAIADFAALTGGENLFVLATAPGEETLCCGALVAEACARGRPPFVAVLTDGSASPGPGTPEARAAEWEHRTRRAIEALGVPGDWFLMLGLHDGTALSAGRKFEAVVAAVALITWRRDCNAIVAPAAGTGSADAAACGAIAEAAAVRAGLSLLRYRVPGASWPGLRLHAPRAERLRTAALEAHRPLPAHREAYLQAR